MLNFPKIDIEYWLVEWDTTQREKAYFTPKMNLYSSIKKDITLIDCEHQILSIIRKVKNPCDEKNEVFKVIDLIYRWGGPSGRMFYLRLNSNGNSPRRELELRNDLFTRYCDSIELARAGKASSKFLFETIPGIGPSFASKHAAFWSAGSKRPLIVIDAKIAGCFGKQNLELFEKEFNYESTLNEFIEYGKSLKIPKNSQEIERAFFTFHSHFFNNENTGWQTNKKKAFEDKDYQIAESLAKQLGII